MNTKVVRVEVGAGYDAVVGYKILAGVGELIRERIEGVETVAVITDSIVSQLYAETVLRALKRVGYHAIMYAFPHGEANKSLETVENVLKFLAATRVTRTDLIVALGGGVVGDVAGFAASIYMRGIKYVQVPTTLLAAVDSSVGGKTGVNMKYGKNLVGTIWQPSMVAFDLHTLETLKPMFIRDGMAECIKHGVLADKEILFMIRQKEYKNVEFITRNITVKASFVVGDERDENKRQMLNLGHTFGHVIEQISGFSVTHGHAVAVGMMCVTRAAVHLGKTSYECYFEILETLKAAKLPYITRFDTQIIQNVMTLDKKIANDSLNLIYPKEIGNCVMWPVEVKNIHRVIHYAMKEVLG